MTEFLTKNADVALIEIKEKLYERLAEIRRIKHDFAAQSRIDPVWEGIVGQCGSEERFLSKLLDTIERS
jgi:hypothetical protein